MLVSLQPESCESELEPWDLGRRYPAWLVVFPLSLREGSGVGKDGCKRARSFIVPVYTG